jgi:transcriptional regulator NrdR family protein
MSDCYFCSTKVVDYKVVERFTKDGATVRRISCKKCYDVFDAIMTVVPSFAKWDSPAEISSRTA